MKALQDKRRASGAPFHTAKRTRWDFWGGRDFRGGCACGAIHGHGMPCPYEGNSKVNGAQLKLAATEATSEAASEST